MKKTYLEDGIAAPIQAEASEKPGILLIGDSIRMGYCETVREFFKDEADVFYPEENCRNTQYVITCLNSWAMQFPRERIRLVQFNCGHWDAAHWNGDAEPLTAPEEYVRNIRLIIRQLRRFYPQAKLVFATTTIMNPNGAQSVNERTTAQIAQYNALAEAAAREEGVPVNDLYAVSSTYDETAFEDYCHLTPEKFRELGLHVAQYLKSML